MDELKSIKNILTLRYNPEASPGIPLKKLEDFSTTKSDEDGNVTEALLLDSLHFVKEEKRIGIALSSGVDSSLILAIIREINPDLEIVSIHYTGTNNQELADTKRLAQKFNAELHLCTLSTVFGHITKMVSMLKEPKWDAYDFIIYKTAKELNLTKILTGDGADELFAGYTFRYNSFLDQYYSVSSNYFKIHPNELIALYLQVHKNDFVEDQEELFQDDFSFTRDIDVYFKKIFESDLDPLNKVLLADYNGKLAYNFSLKKKAFAKEYLPIFSPYLTDEITNFATHLPPIEKYHHGIGKWHLRKIAQRYNVFPAEKKLGFTHNIKEDWKNHKDWVLPYLQNPERLIYKRKIINPKWLERNKDSQEERVINKIVSLYTVEEYLKWLM